MQETVLLYNIDKTEAGKAIISILEKLNVEFNESYWLYFRY